MKGYSDLIAAPATPFGSSAIAVIRTSGERCVDTLARVTDREEKLSATPGGRLRRAVLIDPETGKALDDVMLGIYRGPASYTGEDAVEIFCHGSIPGIQEILALLHRSGFRPAEPGEFTLRAFLAGKVDLTRAEAVQELVRSRTAQGHGMALHRLGGSVEKEVNRIKAQLVTLMAHVAVQIDYPEEETGEIPLPLETIREARHALEALSATYRAGRLYQEGVRLALAGRTNAGKSSLFNAFLKEDRAIVSETPGTTRDYIESTLDIEGVPVTVFDTAGMRRTTEAIEEEGIRRTANVLKGADFVLYIVDGIEGITEEDRAVMDSLMSTPDRTLLLWNKIDDPRSFPVPSGFFPVSAVTFRGIDTLIAEILKRVTRDTGHPEHIPVIDSLRQRDLLKRSASALLEVEEGIARDVPIDAISLDLQESIHALGEITGEVSSADVLEAVFDGFCVGK